MRRFEGDYKREFLGKINVKIDFEFSKLIFEIF